MRRPAVRCRRAPAAPFGSGRRDETADRSPRIRPKRDLRLQQEAEPRAAHCCGRLQQSVERFNGLRGRKEATAE